MTKPFSDDVFLKNFNIHKAQQDILQDASRKSSIDVHIRGLVDCINSSDNYFTTSSCSGRFLAFSQDEVYVKKNCEWIKVSHDPLSDQEIEQFVIFFYNLEK
jgi:tRNA wybutosine-synthesizing protein 3